MFAYLCFVTEHPTNSLPAEDSPEQRPHTGGLYDLTTIRFSSNTAITINSALVQPSLPKAQVQKFKSYVGRQGERENSFRQPQELDLPLTCVLPPCFAKKPKKSKPKGETKQARILCSSQRKLDLTTHLA